MIDRFEIEKCNQGFYLKVERTTLRGMHSGETVKTYAFEYLSSLQLFLSAELDKLYGESSADLPQGENE